MFNFEKGRWMNEKMSKDRSVDNETKRIRICADKKTDMWQNTHYGFKVNNAPCFVWEKNQDDEMEVQFTAKSTRLYENSIPEMYDQCGLIIYADSENWFKCSVEYENSEYSRLGSVVTNFGFSDWATTDVKSESGFVAWYRITMERNNDFVLEGSFDGISFKQMRVFHLNVPKNTPVVLFGVYSCSPKENGSFVAEFSDFDFKIKKKQ